MANTNIPASFVVAGSALEFDWPDELTLQVVSVTGGTLSKNGSEVTVFPETFATGDTLLVNPTAGGAAVVKGQMLSFNLETSALRTPSGTPINRVLISKSGNLTEWVPYAPEGLYSTGGFLVAPIALNQDQPDVDAWDLLSDQITTTDTVVPTYVDIGFTGGTIHYDSTQTANTEWFVHFNNDREFLFQMVRIGFDDGGSGGSANYQLSIMDGSTVVASTSAVVSGAASNADFTFSSPTAMPAAGKLRLTRTGGTSTILPEFVGNVVAYDEGGISTDFIVRNSSGTVITSATYGTMGLHIPLIENIRDLVEAETVSVTSTSTTYSVSGMHVTRLDVPISNIEQPGVQHWIIELEALAHTHTSMAEGVAFGVQQERGQDTPATFWGLVRMNGTLAFYKDVAANNLLDGTDNLVTLDTGETYRFEFTLNTNTTNSTLHLEGIWRSSDGNQMLGSRTSPTFASSENPLFCLVAGGEGGVFAHLGVNVVRPMPVRVHRWVEWRE
ncbi:hypothetical protein [Deinococcus cellulosilyticus]|uniref:Uncharacterized protein n=1 Tax=Deinococcus cellulosilyticus (strain DSM 18568 / NBRC 106333 / KACC 11606 / 5516J-15) TaxID=1223518 RepID=A0A511MZA2_DEIC1|nr:hypothetical protein [Deinococcus cellulosilyticus]GEM45923.1 hypothetical protein DC3_15580 [Deinococcus cellulosilyticus NBRC 106333 = KACC 11606]